MSHSSRRVLYWSIAAAYLAANYLLLPHAPGVWHQIQAAIGGHGSEAMLVLYGVIAIGAAAAYRRAGPRSWPAHLAALGLIAAFALMYSLEHYASEKIHMFEYGAFGGLLYLALRVDLNPSRPWLYVIGGTIGAIAGLVDELIQDALPNRVFTWHDIFVNGGSALLVLAFLRLQATRRKTS